MEQNDWTYVKEIYIEGLNEGKSTFQTTVPTYEQWDAGHSKECRYVAIDNEKVVGWIAISPTSSREVYCGVAEVSIYINSEYRNKGIGKQLMNCLCVESERKGYWSLYSSIFAINEGSIQLHKACGFREIGYRERIAKDRFGNWQNTVLMERRNKIK